MNDPFHIPKITRKVAKLGCAVTHELNEYLDRKAELENEYDSKCEALNKWLVGSKYPVLDGNSRDEMAEMLYEFYIGDISAETLKERLETIAEERLDTEKMNGVDDREPQDIDNYG